MITNDESSESSDSDIEMSFADSDDDLGIFEIDATKCPKCGKGDEGGVMVGCDTCPRWWHKECTGDPDIKDLSDSDLEAYLFDCLYCEV